MGDTNPIPLDGASLPLVVTPTRQKCLVVLHADGWVEVYGERSLSVKIVQRIAVSAAEDADTADQLIDLALPRGWRNLYWPMKLRAAQGVDRVTAQRKLDALMDLEILRAIKELGR
jgi:hypothetical protein